MPLTNSTIRGTSNGSFSLQILNCNSSCNRNIQKNEAPLYTVNDDYNIKNTKSMHQYNSLHSPSKCLDMNQLEVLPLEEIDNFSLRYKVQDFGKTSLFSKEPLGGVEDLFQSSNLNSPSTLENHPTICNSSNIFVETERSTLNEAYIWNDIDFERTKPPHIEDASKRLESSSNTSSNRDSHDMDIDNSYTSNIDDMLESKRIINMSSNNSTSVSLDLPKSCKNCGDEGISQSSNDLLGSQDFHCSKRNLEVERYDSESSTRTHGVEVRTLNQNHQIESIKENSWIQQPSKGGHILIDENNLERYDLKSSPKIHQRELEPTNQIESLKEDSLIEQSCHECHILIDELPPLIINSEKKMSTTKITRSGIEIHEESYDIRPLEEDIPYVVVEALSTKSTIPQIYQEQPLQEEDIPNQSMKMKNNVMECTNGEMLNVGTTNNVVTLKEAQSKISIFASDTKLKKQATKPLFFSGFLNKSPKSTFTNSLNRNIVTNGKGSSSSKENVQGQFIKGGESLSNWRHTSTPNSNGKENSDQRMNCHITNNGIHNNGILEFNKKSKDLPSDIGRKNGVSIVI